MSHQLSPHHITFHHLPVHRTTLVFFQRLTHSFEPVVQAILRWNRGEVSEGTLENFVCWWKLRFQRTQRSLRVPLSASHPSAIAGWELIHFVLGCGYWLIITHCRLWCSCDCYWSFNGRGCVVDQAALTKSVLPLSVSRRDAKSQEIIASGPMRTKSFVIKDVLSVSTSETRTGHCRCKICEDQNSCSTYSSPLLDLPYPRAGYSFLIRKKNVFSRLWIFVRRRPALCRQDVSGQLFASHFDFPNLRHIDFSGTHVSGHIDFVNNLTKLVYLNLKNTQAAVRVSCCPKLHSVASNRWEGLNSHVSVSLARCVAILRIWSACQTWIRFIWVAPALEARFSATENCRPGVSMKDMKQWMQEWEVQHFASCVCHFTWFGNVRSLVACLLAGLVHGWHVMWCGVMWCSVVWSSVWFKLQRHGIWCTLSLYNLKCVSVGSASVHCNVLVVWCGCQVVKCTSML